MSAVEPIVWSERPLRRIGRGLALGVLIAPLLFVWVLLLPGYSPRARILGFGWLAVRIAGELALLAQFGWPLDRILRAIG